MSDENINGINSAAEFFYESARKLLSTKQGLHPETLISSVARMAGSLMYRSFGFDQKVEPGTTVLSDEANMKGPKLMDLMFVTLQQLGNKIGEENINREDATAKLSQLNFKESHELLAPTFLKHCETAQVSHETAAFGAAVATAILIHDCREALDIEKGAGIAIYGFVEGTKTAPFPLISDLTEATEPDFLAKKKPWYKIW